MLLQHEFCDTLGAVLVLMVEIGDMSVYRTDQEQVKISSQWYFVSQWADKPTDMIQHEAMIKALCDSSDLCFKGQIKYIKFTTKLH